MIELHVSEYIQVAHRLIELPGKCQQIHGHSMHVTLSLLCELDKNGYAINEHKEVVDFSGVKKSFRAYLNDDFDHHLLLNDDDPWLRKCIDSSIMIPGVIGTDGDPTTENIAKWIFEFMKGCLGSIVHEVKIEETATNGVKYREEFVR